MLPGSSSFGVHRAQCISRSLVLHTNLVRSCVPGTNKYCFISHCVDTRHIIIDSEGPDWLIMMQPTSPGRFQGDFVATMRASASLQKALAQSASGRRAWSDRYSDGESVVTRRHNPKASLRGLGSETPIPTRTRSPRAGPTRTHWQPEAPSRGHRPQARAATVTQAGSAAAALGLRLAVTGTVPVGSESACQCTSESDRTMRTGHSQGRPGRGPSQSPQPGVACALPCH